jgi:hypothetical protein
MENKEIPNENKPENSAHSITELEDANMALFSCTEDNKRLALELESLRTANRDLRNLLEGARETLLACLEYEGGYPEGSEITHHDIDKYFKEHP